MSKTKIGFIGPQGSGKTTTAYALASELKKKGNDVYVLSEVARSCPLPLNEGTSIETQLWILGKQITREQSAKAQILVSDRTVLDVFCYGMWIAPDFFTQAKPFIKEYLSSYDYIFYLKPNDDYLVDDGIRSTNKDFRNDIDGLMTKYIEELQIPSIVIDSGDIVNIMLCLQGDDNVQII